MKIPLCSSSALKAGLCGLLLATQVQSFAATATPDPLAFDAAKYTVKTVTVDGKAVSFRAYEGIVYVANPVDAKYQSMNVYVPTAYYEGSTINGYTADTAPIFFPNSVGGYMPGLPASATGNGMGPGMPPGGAPGAAPRLPPGAPVGAGAPADMGPPPVQAGAPTLPPQIGTGKKTNTIAAALAEGFVVAAPGARGRTLKDSSGNYSGKAPACIVDLKAAVRYLRHNDAVIPGSAERIISNGTSAGGALSALVGATGNAKDYEPYLKALGAADERDDVFATSCYCPITNLDNADAAYEWLFNGVNSYQGRSGKGEMNAEQIAVSARLKALFPSYLNSLSLFAPNGTKLSLDAKGTGSFADYVKTFLIASAQSALESGKDLSKLDWLTIENGKVTQADLTKYATFATRMKTAPAFDALDLGSGENNLFGTASINNQHFTPFGVENSSDDTQADASAVRMLNPMNYIGNGTATTAKYWRLRHGAIDRDTSLAISVILTTKLQNSGFTADLAFPWATGHSGDYDLPALFAWIHRLPR